MNKSEAFDLPKIKTSRKSCFSWKFSRSSKTNSVALSNADLNAPGGSCTNGKWLATSSPAVKNIPEILTSSDSEESDEEDATFTINNHCFKSKSRTSKKLLGEELVTFQKESNNESEARKMFANFKSRSIGEALVTFQKDTNIKSEATNFKSRSIGEALVTFQKESNNESEATKMFANFKSRSIGEEFPKASNPNSKSCRSIGEASMFIAESLLDSDESEAEGAASSLIMSQVLQARVAFEEKEYDSVTTSDSDESEAEIESAPVNSDEEDSANWIFVRPSVTLEESPLPARLHNKVSSRSCLDETSPEELEDASKSIISDSTDDETDYTSWLFVRPPVVASYSYSTLMKLESSNAEILSANNNNNNQAAESEESEDEELEVPQGKCLPWTSAFLAETSRSTTLISEPKTDFWYVDNGATNHITYQEEIFSSFEPFVTPHAVRTASGTSVCALGKGEVEVEVISNGYWKRITLSDVWYVPSIRKNLFSVLAAQDKQPRTEFKSSAEHCRLKDGSILNLIGTRKRFGGLFKLKMRSVKSRLSADANFSEKDNLLQLYHERFGHQNKRYVRTVLRRELGLKVEADGDACTACAPGRAPERRVSAKKPGELISVDVYGPFESSVSGFKYSVLFKDDYTSYRFAYFLKDISEVAVKLKQMLEEVRSDGYKVHGIRCYEGDAIVNRTLKKVLYREIIKQSFTSEREAPTVMDMARAIMHAHGNIPQKLWAEMVHTSTYILNRTGPSSVPRWSPYELWFGEKAMLKHFRVIGSTCYANLESNKGNKIDRKAVQGILVGYSKDDAYRIWCPESDKVIKSRDALFNEEIVDKKIINLARYYDTIVEEESLERGGKNKPGPKNKKENEKVSVQYEEILQKGSFTTCSGSVLSSNKYEENFICKTPRSYESSVISDPKNRQYSNVDKLHRILIRLQ